MKIGTILLGIIFTALSLWSQETNEPSQMDLLNDERVTQIGDRLVYQVVEEREPGMVVFVNDRGQIDLPLIGAIEAKGKTPRTIAYDVKAKLEETFFHRATVLLRYQFADNSRGRISLVGQVARPGMMNVPADEILTVSNSIIRAGGFLPGADSQKVLLKRSRETLEGESTQEFVINVLDIFENGNVAADMVVRPDDIIIVPKKEGVLGNYYVTGSVNNPGEFGMPRDGTEVTLSQAILRAGGFSKFANQSSVVVMRTNEGGEQETYTINVKEILEEGNRTNDMTLRTNDIIRVKEVLFAF